MPDAFAHTSRPSAAGRDSREMGDSSPLLRPGTLWPALLEATRRANACGAIRPIRTVQEFIDDGGVRFLVRKVSSLARKDEDRAARQAQEAAGAPVNPFLPCEPDLVVGDLSDSHRAVLNKFNVIDHHLLIVTRRFMDQETLLDANDFAALAVCMAEIDGLGFYNGGTAAGASQPHKHLQLVPLPLADTGPALPVEGLFEAVRGVPGICRVPGLPFAHALSWLEPSLFSAPPRTAAALLARYRELLAALSLSAIRSGGEERQSAPYNLLLTRRWMLLVPRSREHCETVSVNALGYAGSLFVRNDEQLATVKRIGPMSLLRAVALA